MGLMPEWKGWAVWAARLLPAALGHVHLPPGRRHEAVGLARRQGAEVEAAAALAHEAEVAAGLEAFVPGLAGADGELRAGLALEQEGAEGDAVGGVGDREPLVAGRRVRGVGGAGAGG